MAVIATPAAGVAIAVAVAAMKERGDARHDAEGVPVGAPIGFRQSAGGNYQVVLLLLER